MATSIFASERWTTGTPTMRFNLSYDSARDGLNMKYKFYFNFEAIQGYFAYPINATLNVGGTTATIAVKGVEPQYWSDSNTVKFTSDWMTVNTSAATVAMSLRLVAVGGTRDVTYTANIATIPLGAIFTDSNNDSTIGVQRTIAITRLSTNYTHKLEFVSGSYTQNISGSTTSTNINWTPASAIGDLNPYGREVEGVLRLSSLSGSTVVGIVEQSVTVTVPQYSITVSAPTFTDTNGLYAQYGAYVQSKSVLSASANWTNRYGSTISRWSITIAGTTYTSTTSPMSGIALPTSGSVSYTVSLTDSRGGVGAYSGTITVASYTPITARLSAFRSDATGNADETGDYITCVENGSICNINNANVNSKSFVIKQCEYTASVMTVQDTYTDAYTVTDRAVTFAADRTKAYLVVMIVTDSFGSGSIGPITVPKAQVWLQGSDDGTGYGLGEVAVNGEFRCVPDATFRGDLNVEGEYKKNGVAFGVTKIYENYTGTSSAISFTTANYSLIIVGGKVNGASSSSSVVCPVSNDSIGQAFQFTDDSSWYKFTLTSSGISALQTGSGVVTYVYGISF